MERVGPLEVRRVGGVAFSDFDDAIFQRNGRVGIDEILHSSVGRRNDRLCRIHRLDYRQSKALGSVRRNIAVDQLKQAVHVAVVQNRAHQHNIRPMRRPGAYLRHIGAV